MLFFDEISEVIRAVATMTMPKCSVVKIYRHFGETNCLHVLVIRRVVPHITVFFVPFL